jgi:hypothetical protein
MTGSSGDLVIQFQLIIPMDAPFVNNRTWTYPHFKSIYLYKVFVLSIW